MLCEERTGGVKKPLKNIVHQGYNHRGRETAAVIDGIIDATSSSEPEVEFERVATMRVKELRFPAMRVIVARKKKRLIFGGDGRIYLIMKERETKRRLRFFQLYMKIGLGFKIGLTWVNIYFCFKRNELEYTTL